MAAAMPAGIALAFAAAGSLLLRQRRLGAYVGLGVTITLLCARLLIVLVFPSAAGIKLSVDLLLKVGALVLAFTSIRLLRGGQAGA